MSWKVRVPAMERSVRMNQCVIANALHRSGGESELFSLWISEAKASPGWAPLTKIFFWLNNLFPPGFEPQTFLCEHTHSKHCATEDFTILLLKILIYTIVIQVFISFRLWKTIFPQIVTIKKALKCILYIINKNSWYFVKEASNPKNKGTLLSSILKVRESKVVLFFSYLAF